MAIIICLPIRRIGILAGLTASVKCILASFFICEISIFTDPLIQILYNAVRQHLRIVLHRILHCALSYFFSCNTVTFSYYRPFQKYCKANPHML